jgi:hypothetical protein
LYSNSRTIVSAHGVLLIASQAGRELRCVSRGGQGILMS